MTTQRLTEKKIIDTALELADQSEWETVCLYHIAQQLDVTLADIHKHFREKEELADAWFDRADLAMLKVSQQKNFYRQSSRDQIEQLIMTWLTCLGQYQTVTKDIIINKLEPGHVHVQIPALLRISRTVQWIREASHQDSTFIRRALDETALTSVFVATLVYWLNDDSEHYQRTLECLRRGLSLIIR